MEYGKIADGIWLMGNNPPILIENEEKLEEITGASPGQMACTAVGRIWMLDTDGTTWRAFGASAPASGSEEG